jgi:hypothetical protein
VTKYGFHARKLSDLVDLDLLATRVELVVSSGSQLHGQVLGPSAFLVDALAK